MGGGGGDTTNVTNTGLGDDQYQTLADNQVGISGQITDARTDATERYDKFDTRFDGIDTSLTGIGSNLTSGFTNMQDLMDTYNTGMNTQFDGVNTNVGANNTAINNNNTAIGNLATDVSGGFDTMGGRFDNVDAATSNVQTSVDQGFVDQAQGFTDAQADRTAQFDTTNTGVAAGFEEAGAALSKGFGDTATQLTNTQANVLEGQNNLGTTLDTMQGTADAYATTQLENQANMQANQEGFVTSFDNYVDRYSDDTTLANQTRADLQLAQSNAAKALRTDIGKYAQAAAQGQDNINRNIGTLGEGSARGFEVLADTVQGGFSDTTAANQLESQNLSSRIGNVKSLLQTTGETIDATSREQYTALANSFDENGQLIANSVDAQGNTISRAMDDQGRIIETKFDGSGAEISKVQMDVETMLSNAEQYQSSLTGQISGLQEVTEGGFTGVDSALGAGFADTERGQQDLTNTVQTGQQGLMAETVNTQDMLGTASQQLLRGFDETSGTLDIQTRDLANIASGQSDLDIRMRQDFKQVSNAFDDQGLLITNTVADNGTTISRAVDQNGNLLLRAFDAQGNRIGDKVLNINRTLFDLQNLQTQTGGNVSMGNLSAPMQGEIPTSGFASPFTTTR